MRFSFLDGGRVVKDLSSKVDAAPSGGSLRSLIEREDNWNYDCYGTAYKNI